MYALLLLVVASTPQYGHDPEQATSKCSLVSPQKIASQQELVVVVLLLLLEESRMRNQQHQDNKIKTNLLNGSIHGRVSIRCFCIYISIEAIPN